MIVAEQVERVYSGKANVCACGCAGKYYEAAESKAMTTRVLNAINRHIVAAQFDEQGEYIAVDLDQRTYVAYFKQEKK